MLHWREILIEAGFSGADIDINDPYGYRFTESKEWQDSVAKGRKDLKEDIKEGIKLQQRV